MPDLNSPAACKVLVSTECWLDAADSSVTSHSADTTKEHSPAAFQTHITLTLHCVHAERESESPWINPWGAKFEKLLNELSNLYTVPDMLWWQWFLLLLYGQNGSGVYFGESGVVFTEAVRESVVQNDTVNINAALTSLPALALQILMNVTTKPSVGATASVRTQMAHSAASVTEATPTLREIWPDVSVCYCCPESIRCRQAKLACSYKCVFQN